MFSEQQKEILKNSAIELVSLTEESVEAIATQQIDHTDLSDEQLVEFLEIANALYRGGAQIISDEEYDFTFLDDLRLRNPQHPFLNEVEPEAAFIGKTVALPARMLSTDKAYTKKKIEQWASTIRKEAGKAEKDFDLLEFRVTPKLDGFAAYDDGERLYTRGDGRRGTDITRVFERGLTVADGGERGLGPGEIVVNRPFFDQHLQPYFENARNFQTSVIREKELDQHTKRAITEKAVVFYPFALLPSWKGSWLQLSADFEDIVTQYRTAVPYDVDGVIIEITDEELKNKLGMTRHHHKWQIAYKENLEAAHVKVLEVFAQTSRSGRINPVARVEPTRLSGATIQRATAHHYKMVVDKGIGPGAIIELTRSGEVIPKIGEVIEPAEPVLPTACPSCGSEVDWDGDYLYCTNNLECPAQIANTMEHFFRMLRHVDLFGSATIQKLYDSGIRSVDQIYQLTATDFEGYGFGPKQSENLVDQLNRSRNERIEDWRFLTAFGVFRLGPGNCEKLLGRYPLEEVFNLSEEQVVNVEGFAEKTAKIVVEGLRRVKPLFDKLYYGLNFNLEKTPLAGQGETASSPIAGKLIVFTGAMTHGSRDDMEKEAKALGAKVGKSVTGKTDLLVTGENVGETKIAEARKKGVEIVSEEQYLALLQGEPGEEQP
jgi:DNA ligase (NAD+)